MSTSIQKQKTVIVLGMHRSGTSLIAGMLKILGVDMGDKLLGKDPYNIRGHFEALDFLALNEKILAAMNASSVKPPIEKMLKADNIVFCFREEIKNIVAKNKQKFLWGWKDPRTALTIELYLPYLFNPYFVVCFRNPYEAARSLKERDGFDIIGALKLTNIYNQRIINFLQKHSTLPRILIALEDVIKQPLLEVKRLCRFLDLELTKEKQKLIRELIVPSEDIQKAKQRISRQSEFKLTRELEETKTHLQNIYNSRSWKMTTPLRCAKRFIIKLLSAPF